MKKQRKFIFPILVVLFAIGLSLFFFISYRFSLEGKTAPTYLQEYLSDSIKNKHVWTIEKISKEDESQSTYMISDTNSNSSFFLANPNQIGASDLIGKKITIDGTFKMSDKSSEGRLKDMSAVVLEVTSFELVK